MLVTLLSVRRETIRSSYRSDSASGIKFVTVIVGKRDAIRSFNTENSVSLVTFGTIGSVPRSSSTKSGTLV